MRSIKNLEGQKFGRLTVQKLDGRRNNKTYWLCVCDCETTLSVRQDHLQNGSVKSCGCLHDELSRIRAREQFTSHGAGHERLYNIWCGIKQRCYYKNHNRYAQYGGRGIMMCDSWKNDYQEFKKWALANGYDADAKRGECTIDRIDVNGNYEPQNCRFVSMKVQNNNRRI